MTAQNKILLGFIAIAAFAFGLSYNSARISNQIDTEVLLNARLITTKLTQEPLDSAEGFLPGAESLSSVKDSLGELTLVNFWASWCTPCREEMPIFENMYRQSKEDGFVVVGIAIDSPDKAQPMLDSMDISYPILFAEETGIDIMASVGNPQGLLPYSLLLDNDGNVIEQVLGQIHEQQIADWIVDHL